MTEFFALCGVLACLLVIIFLIICACAWYESCKQSYWKRKFGSLYKSIEDNSLLLTLKYNPENRMSLVRVQQLLASLVNGYDNPFPDTEPSKWVSNELSAKECKGNKEKWFSYLPCASISVRNLISCSQIQFVHMQAEVNHKRWAANGLDDKDSENQQPVVEWPELENDEDSKKSPVNSEEVTETSVSYAMRKIFQAHIGRPGTEEEMLAALPAICDKLGSYATLYGTPEIDKLHDTHWQQVRRITHLRIAILGVIRANNHGLYTNLSDEQLIEHCHDMSDKLRAIRTKMEHTDGN